jgi:cysteinyl-tRNA synthetase
MIRVYDTLQKRKVEFEPIDPANVRLYACGPTVYNLIHIGNGRAFVVFDVVYRHLRRRFPKTTYVRNVTDVDDKIIKRAAERGEDPGALASRFCDEFQRDVAALGCLAPTVEPRVTEHLDDIVKLIDKLIVKGLAYAADGDVYFAVQQFPPYGQLSGQPLDQLAAGARVEVDERKRSPLDFALWKAAKPGEPSWPSPWGAGRPGWHIECSAMASRYLGDTFDLHGGGADLVFPHHENERAQSQGAAGVGTFARYWLHNGFVNFNDQKISKSDEKMRKLLESAFLVRVLVERHGGEAVRWLLLTTQYRHPINFEMEETDGGLRFPGLEEAERQLEYGYLTRRRLAEALAVGKPGGDGAIVDEAGAWLPALDEALDDDFNTAGAFAALQQGLALANRLLDGKLAAPKDVKRRTLERLAADLGAASSSLGILEADASAWLAAHRQRRATARGIEPATVEARIAERAAARKARDFARGDAIRDELRAGGIELMDGATGTSWRVAD